MINLDVADSFFYISNDEYIIAVIDAENRILAGIKYDGKPYFPNHEMYSVIANEEWLYAIIDAEDKILFGFKTNGKTYVGDADFLDDIKNNQEAISEIKSYLANFINLHIDALSSITAVDNPEFIEVTTDSEDKVLAGRTHDGAAFENVGFSAPKVSIDGHIIEDIEDPEGRREIITDSEGKIISYRDKDGVKHEDAGIKTNHLILTHQGMTDFQKALKESGFNSGANDWSDAKSIEIPTPRCALVNIVSSNNDLAVWPESKTTNAHYYMQFWDMQGNYFKKEIIFNAQGNSSMGFIKKNGSADFCNNNGWDDNDTFSIKFGNWVAQDSFHFKSYYLDYLRGSAVVAYQFANDVYKTRGIYADRPWKKALIDFNKILPTTPGGLSADGISDIDLQIDNGARCMPDGFPAIFYLNGEFYGIYSWQLKKHRDNYHLNKKIPEQIQLDGELYYNYLWGGNIDWTRFEIRNPKDLYCMDGSKYDGDNPQELIDSTSPNYDSANKKHKNSAKVKQYIINLSHRVSEINTLDATDSAAAKALFDKYFDADNLIDYQLINMALGDVDGFGKNWQWVTYDGIKWYVCQYDKDLSFGYYWIGTHTTPPLNGWITGPSSSLPTGLAVKYYQAEHKARWQELKELGLMTADRLIKGVSDWVARVGRDNYAKEWEKWPDSPCNRDSHIDFTNWVFDNQIVWSEPASDVWNNSTEYHANDVVWFLDFDGQWLRFKSKTTNTNKPPLTQGYLISPKSMGFRDSMWRICKYIQQTIKNQDNFFNNL